MIKRNLKRIRDFLKLELQRDIWRKNNRNNYTQMGCYFPIDVVRVGNATYGTLNIHYYKTEKEKITIGSFCSIANDVHFFLGGGHNYKNLLTFPSKNHISNNNIKDSITKGPIDIQDDVWIGYGTVILSGVTIGKGAVIGACSVVTKDVPPYAIIAGNIVIRYRFSEDVIEKLVKTDFTNMSLNRIAKNMDLFYTPLDATNIDGFLKVFED